MKESDIEIVERDNNIPPEKSILVNRRSKMKKDFNVMEACTASALDFIDTVLFCMKEDGFEDDVIDDYKEYLLAVHEMHYNTDIGEQGENITKYLDECGYYDEDLKQTVFLNSTN